MSSTAAQNAARTNGRIQAGLCVICGLVPPRDGRRDCNDCAQHRSTLRAGRVLARNIAGTCSACGAIAPVGKTKCSLHEERSRASSERYHRRNGARVEVVVATLLRRARARALERGMEFRITAVDLGTPPTHCPILGLQLQYERPGTKGPRDGSPSIDRIDNTRGYIKGNVRLISHRANRLRSDANFAELQAITRDMQLVAEAHLTQH